MYPNKNQILLLSEEKNYRYDSGIHWLPALRGNMTYTKNGYTLVYNYNKIIKEKTRNNIKPVSL